MLVGADYQRAAFVAGSTATRMRLMGTKRACGSVLDIRVLRLRPAGVTPAGPTSGIPNEHAITIDAERQLTVDSIARRICAVSVPGVNGFCRKNIPFVESGPSGKASPG